MKADFAGIYWPILLFAGPGNIERYGKPVDCRVADLDSFGATDAFIGRRDTQAGRTTGRAKCELAPRIRKSRADAPGCSVRIYLFDLDVVKYARAVSRRVKDQVVTAGLESIQHKITF